MGEDLQGRKESKGRRGKVNAWPGVNGRTWLISEYTEQHDEERKALPGWKQHSLHPSSGQLGTPREAQF